MARKNSRKKPESPAALDKLAATLEGLPASRRAALERDLVALDRRATYGGAKRGRRPKLGESLTEAVLVRLTPALKVEMAAAAKRLGFDGIAEYLRELHAQAEARRR